MKKLSAAFLTLVLVSACGGGSGGSSSGAAGGGNSAPLITSGNTYSVAEGATSIGTVSASDVDGDNLTFSLSGADAGVISIGSTSGALSFNSPADFESPVDDGGDNVYNVTARVGDGSAFDARDLVITVTNNNDAPVITSGGAYTITENVTVIGSVDASDSDGDTLSYTLSGDDASLMTVSSSGALAFIAAPDFEAPADTGADNVYNASVAVSDGTDTVSQAITVTITDLEEGTPSNEIFISEYAEGSSNNKYLEISNFTGASVSLDEYALASTSNAPTTAGEYEFWNEVFGTGSSVADKDVFVVCHGSASSEISAKCDSTHNFLSNGDDGYKLVKGGTWTDTDEDGNKDAGEVTGFTVIDVLGDFQGDPGSGWEVCGVANGTVNHTLVKKEGVEGNTDWTASRGTSAEDCDWIVKEQDDSSDLGQHCWESEFAAESIVINNASGEVSVAENGTSVATVSTTVSACGSVAYSLTGDDAGRFMISETGVVEFAAAPDFEAPADLNADNVYNFNVVATNGSASDSLAM
ncbi:MAG: lamin tail domain-containing protein, partial [Gammaproteobacteria bacterium]